MIIIVHLMYSTRLQLQLLQLARRIVGFSMRTESREESVGAGQLGSFDSDRQFE